MPTIFITDLHGTLLGHNDFGFAVIRDDILSFLERGVNITFLSAFPAEAEFLVSTAHVEPLII